MLQWEYGSLSEAGEGWGTMAETCPKCGYESVTTDECPRCRVIVSKYRAHAPRAEKSSGGSFTRLFAILGWVPLILVSFVAERWVGLRWGMLITAAWLAIGGLWWLTVDTWTTQPRQGALRPHLSPSWQEEEDERS